MRSFIISIALLLSLIGTWCFFDTYSSNTLENYGQILESEVLLSIESENWQSASEDFLSLQEEWQEYKQYAVFFLGTSELNEVDETMAKAYYYIKAEDISNASGEIAFLKRQLLFLNSNEKMTAGNIF